MKVKDRDDEYLKRNFTGLVKKYGGRWIVIVNGKRFAIVPKSLLPATMKKARQKYPDSIPLASPIPTSQDLQCLLKF